MRKVLVAGILLSCFAVNAYAQTEATLLGTAADQSGAVLPGVTITATDSSTGRQYLGVTDARGAYRIPGMQPGTYRLQAELTGFSTVVVPRVDLLVGQNADIPITLQISTVQETITVSGESPLINTQTLEVGGNIDRLQMEQLPVQGRNWMELSMLVKGVTANDVGQNRPVPREDMQQLNLDGQQITQQVSGSGAFGQPRLSREAIAEYQVLSNMYDVTMGRSVGVQIQAISRGGTNETRGTFYGNFRDDSFNAADHVANRVLPYSNQQTGFSLGGPIRRDKLHYFGTYEYEREPQTVLSTPTGYPAGTSLALPTTVVQHSLLGRADYQISNRDHLVVRGTYANYKNPFGQVTGSEYPAAASSDWRYSTILTGNWTRVMSSNAVQEVKVGYYYYYWKYDLADDVPRTPNYSFPGLSIVSKFFYPEFFFQRMPSARYDLNLHRGSHDLKVGGEFLARTDGGWWPVNGRGQYIFNTLPADVSRRFPIDAWNDSSRWDLSGLDPTVLRFTQNFSENFDINIPRKTYALWIGDTWRIGSQLTLNMGARWDLDWGALDPPGISTDFVDKTLPINNGFDPAGLDVGYKTGVRDFGNFAPRAGLSYQVNDGLVLRGGAGLFYGFQVSNLTFGVQLNNGQNVRAMQFNNDGQPGFIQDPTRGLTEDDILSGNVKLPPQNIATIPHAYKNPKTAQANIGFQQQIADTIGIDADLTYSRGIGLGLQRDINLFYNPANGYPQNPNSFGRPLPQYGAITWYESNLKSDYLALASSFTKRLRNNWQGGVTYTLMFFNNDEGTTGLGYIGSVNNPFCISCEWGRSTAFQRHTLRMNAVYQAPWGIVLAGIYSFGSGNPFVTSYPANPFGTSGGLFGLNRYVTAPATIPESVQDRWDGPTSFQTGDLLPKNALMGDALSKLDLRLSKTVTIPGSAVRLEGMIEVFNLFNHANYGGYNGVVTSATFGQPVQNANIAYGPRAMQLAFRVSF